MQAHLLQGLLQSTFFTRAPASTCPLCRAPAAPGAKMHELKVNKAIDELVRERGRERFYCCCSSRAQANRLLRLRCRRDLHDSLGSRCRNFPHQYDSYSRTLREARTRFGSSSSSSCRAAPAGRSPRRRGRRRIEEDPRQDHVGNLPFNIGVMTARRVCSKRMSCGRSRPGTFHAQGAHQPPPWCPAMHPDHRVDHSEWEAWCSVVPYMEAVAVPQRSSRVPSPPRQSRDSRPRRDRTRASSGLSTAAAEAEACANDDARWRPPSTPARCARHRLRPVPLEDY